MLLERVRRFPALLLWLHRLIRVSARDGFFAIMFCTAMLFT
jgi:hypothetical protein